MGKLIYLDNFRLQESDLPPFTLCGGLIVVAPQLVFAQILHPLRHNFAHVVADQKKERWKRLSEFGLCSPSPRFRTRVFSMGGLLQFLTHL